jgi:hypothetical protein
MSDQIHPVELQHLEEFFLSEGTNGLGPNMSLSSDSKTRSRYRLLVGSLHQDYYVILAQGKVASSLESRRRCLLTSRLDLIWKILICSEHPDQ